MLFRLNGLGMGRAWHAIRGIRVADVVFPVLAYTFFLVQGLWSQVPPSYAERRTFSFTGDTQLWVVPSCVDTVLVKVWGAQFWRV